MASNGNWEDPTSQTLKHALLAYQNSHRFREHPLQVRAAFQRVATWLPPRQASLPLAQVNASFAKMLRDKAGRERGYKFGNHTLLMLQSTIKAAIDAGTISKNRVRQVPKLPPPPLPASTCRRRIQPVRQPISSPVNLLKKENNFS